MRPIWKAWYCHIDINNICPYNCAYCTRYIRHFRKDQEYNMDLDMFRKAVLSLDGWPGGIALLGGEPLLHPQFVEICLILRDEFKIPRKKLGLLFSDRKRYLKHKSLIREVFGGMVQLNEHNMEQKKVQLHQPITLAINDVVSNEKYRQKLINNCWVQNAWCPSINPKGGFFCEVAQAIDVILDGPGGYPIEPGWWKKTPEQFKDQVDRYCKYCGAPVPLERELLGSKKEKFSPGLLKLFKAHTLRRLSSKFVEVVDKQFTIKEIEKNKLKWDPRNYRQDTRRDLKEGYKTRPTKPQRNTPIKIGEGRE